MTPGSLVEAILPAVDRRAAVRYLRATVYSLTALLGLALLALGSIAVIAQLKGTWHWMIHLESAVSFMSLVILWTVAALLPAFGLLVAARRWFDA